MRLSSPCEYIDFNVLDIRDGGRVIIDGFKVNIASRFKEWECKREERGSKEVGTPEQEEVRKGIFDGVLKSFVMVDFERRRLLERWVRKRRSLEGE